MIPKKIHYCWFGGSQKDKLVRRCIKSWHKFCQDFEIIEWNESNYNLSDVPEYVSNAYHSKKWAFVSDYVRCDILEKLGGIYMDTDMEIVQDITPLLSNEGFLGFEDAKFVNGAIMGFVPHHPFLNEMLKWYKTNTLTTPIPVIITKLLGDGQSLTEKEQELKNIHIYPRVTFYPYSIYDIKNYKANDITKETYGIHWWNYSWGNPLNRFFKKIGVHKIGIKIVEKIGVKKVIKKVLNFE